MESSPPAQVGCHGDPHTACRRNSGGLNYSRGR
jgi:hypothetical protein